MYSLKEIREYQESEFESIYEKADKIHPKLLSKLTFHNLFDDSFDAAFYEDEYTNKIRPLVIAFNKKVREMLNEHIYDFIQGWVIVHPETRWAIKRSDGSICTEVDRLLLDNYDDYIIDTEIEEYCELVYEMLGEYKIKPFWTYSYILYGNGYRKNINSCGNAVGYIKYGRSAFSGYKSNNEVLERLALDSQSLPFKMLLPPMHNDIANALRNDDLQKCVKHHRVLHAFFESYGKDAPDGEYNSDENEDGKITFRRYDIQ